MNSSSFLLIFVALFSAIYAIDIHPEFSDIVQTNVHASEFVFLASSAENNGLAVFCDSVDMLSKITSTVLNNKEVTITFLSNNVEEMREYVAVRASKWPLFTVKFVNEDNRKQVLEYLSDSSASRVAVISSSSTIAPNTVFECMYAGIPFLSSNFPSISPFFANDASRVAHTFEVKPHHIASKMLSAVRDGLSSAVPAFTIPQAESVWTTLYSTAQPAAIVAEDARFNAHTTTISLSA